MQQLPQRRSQPLRDWEQNVKAANSHDLRATLPKLRTILAALHGAAKGVRTTTYSLRYLTNQSSVPV